MIYVLEGADGTGKTTLANEIARQKGAAVLHAGYHKNWNMAAYHTSLFNAAELMDEYDIPVVLDRWIPSEYVYGHVFRGGASYATDVLLVALRHRVSMVFIYCKNDNVIENHKLNKSLRNELYEDVSEVAKEYDKYFKERPYLKHIEYDFNKVSLSEFVKELPSEDKVD